MWIAFWITKSHGFMGIIGYQPIQFTNLKARLESKSKSSVGLSRALILG